MGPYPGGILLLWVGIATTWLGIFAIGLRIL
jgi:hypothetical protein